MCRSPGPANIVSRSRWTASAKPPCRSPCRRCCRQRRLPLPPRLPVPSTLSLGAYVRLPVLLLAAVLALGFGLGGYPLFDPDEGRNAEVAREMAASNDYVLPHFDGLPYLDKPIVYFAAAAASMEVLGPTETAARLPAYLFTLLPSSLMTGRPIRRLFPIAGLAVFAVVALPWFLAVSRRVPEFPHYVFVRETFERVTTTRFHRTAPFWYYLPIVPVAAFPWIVPALGRLKNWRWAWLARRVNPQAQESILLTCWVLGPLLFFTLNQSKLPQYVLPLLPPFALAAARVLTRQASELGGGVGTARRTYAALAAVFGLALVSLTVWLPAPISLTPGERAAIPPTALALGVALLISAALVWYGGRETHLRPALAVMGYALTVIAMPIVSTL